VFEKRILGKASAPEREHVTGGWRESDVIWNGIIFTLEDKVHRLTCHEGAEGIEVYTLSLTSALDGGGCLAPHPCRLPGTHCVGGCLGPRAELERCEKSRPYWDSIP